MSKWISVKDRLPKKRGFYIVSVHENDTDFISIANFNGTRLVIAFSGAITAWQPLPEPYKEVENESNDNL